MQSRDLAGARRASMVRRRREKTRSVAARRIKAGVGIESGVSDFSQVLVVQKIDLIDKASSVAKMGVGERLRNCCAAHKIARRRDRP